MTLPRHLHTPPLRELMRRLRKHAPLSVPVRLVRRPSPRFGGDLVLAYAGVTFRTRTRKVLSFRIVIDSRLPLGEAWDVLIHEWAHCLDRETRDNPRDWHDARWGQHYSRAFRASQGQR